MLNWIVLNITDYLHKNELTLNNLQRLICHKTQQTKPNRKFLSSKTQLVLNTRNFRQTFSPDLLEKIFWYSEQFLEKAKEWNHLDEGLTYIVDEVE